MTPESTSGQSPAVSIIVPVYNGADTIGRALESVFAQTFRDHEIVVVDDGSTDGLAEALAPFAETGIQVHRHDANQGAAAARNTGAKHARGQYLAFLDADDEWLAGKLEWQVGYLETAPAGTDACCTAHVMLGSSGLTTKVNRPGGTAETVDLGDLLLGCGLSPGSTLLVRQRVFREVGPFDVALRRLEDWDWLIRYASNRLIGTSRKPLAHIHSPSTPTLDDVFDAVEHLYRKHVEGGALVDPRHIRRFHSALLLEKAGAHYRHGARTRAIYFTLRSLAAFPWRNGAFFSRMVNRLLRRG